MVPLTPLAAAADVSIDRLVIATTNQGKIREIRAVLGDLGLTIVAQSDYGALPPVLEDGKTYAANAVNKATAIASRFGVTALADDSGLEVDALGGAPGLLSARFAGPHATDGENRRLLLDRLRGVPVSRRGARFRCALALVDPSGVVRVAEGLVEGVIRDHEAGCGGFGYDPVFELPDRGLTFAELTDDEKNRISHRGRALAKVHAMLLAELKAEG
ncbi:MAG: RdgB/HAM1 family non-canonical purine NTP pyrophosphatase [Nitrospiria bacterium]